MGSILQQIYENNMIKRILSVLSCMVILISLCGCTNKDKVKEELIGYLTSGDYQSAYELLISQSEDVLAYVEEDTLTAVTDVMTSNCIPIDNAERGVKIVNLFSSTDDAMHKSMIELCNDSYSVVQTDKLWNGFGECFNEYNDEINTYLVIIFTALNENNFSRNSYNEFLVALDELERLENTMEIQYSDLSDKCEEYISIIEDIVTGVKGLKSAYSIGNDSDFLFENSKEKLMGGIERKGAMEEEYSDYLELQNEFIDKCIEYLDDKNES